MIKKLTCVLSVILIASCSFAATNDTNTCIVNVSVASTYSQPVVFNAQQAQPPLDTYTLHTQKEIVPGTSGTIEVPCSAVYNLAASPSITPKVVSSHLPGTYAYVGNPVSIGSFGGVSVTFPEDFVKIDN